MAAPEFSRVVPLARLGWDPFRQEIAASDRERDGLAQRFGLFSLDRLSASVELVRQSPESVLLRASFEAEFVQNCVVTLDPVAGALSQSFTLLYGAPETEEPAAASADDECAFEPLLDDSIDIGEAVAQEFSLALPPFPRSPDASVETALQPQPEGPFAALSRLIDRDGC